MTYSDQRAQARSHYLLEKATPEVVSARTQSYLEERAAAGVPGLVLDMSAGGLQVVADDNLHLTHQEYALELVTEGELPFAEGHVRLLWSKAEGEVVRSGFEFVSGFAPLAEIEAMLKNDKHRILRCVLHPIEP